MPPQLPPLPNVRPSTPFSFVLLSCTAEGPTSAPQLDPASSQAARTHHRRSHSFSASIPTSEPADPDQPWRSREVWLALHSRSASPPPSATLPSAGAAGWRSRTGGGAFFGGEVERTTAGRTRTGSESNEGSKKQVGSVENVETETETRQEKWEPGMAIRLLRKKSIAMQRDFGENNAELVCLPHRDTSPREKSPTSPSSSADEFLPPLLPRTATPLMSRASSFTSFNAQPSRPVPWGRRPSLASQSSSESGMPSTPPKIPRRSSSRLSPQGSVPSTPAQCPLTPSRELVNTLPVPARSPLRSLGPVIRSPSVETDVSETTHMAIGLALDGKDQSRIPRSISDSVAVRVVGEETLWTETSSVKSRAVRRGGWI